MGQVSTDFNHSVVLPSPLPRLYLLARVSRRLWKSAVKTELVPRGYAYSVHYTVLFHNQGGYYSNLIYILQAFDLPLSCHTDGLIGRGTMHMCVCLVA